jgi:hypothetical protein
MESLHFMQNNQVFGTTTSITGFSISGIKGNSSNGLKAIFIIKGGSKGNVRTGASADIESTIQIFKKLYSYIEIWRTENKYLDEVCEKITRPKSVKYLKKADCVLLIYSGASGKLVRTLVKNGIKNVAFRAQNPELFHRWDYFLLSRNVKYLAIAFVGLVSDLQAVRNAKLILTISEYDLGLYFSKLKSLARSKVRLYNLSYYPTTSPRLITESQNEKFFIGSSTKSTLISSVDVKLKKLICDRKIYAQDFKGIGYGLESIAESLQSNLGFVADLDKCLQHAGLVVIPSTKGWGFKTKIADFIHEEKQVVIHRDLAKKIDRELLPYLTVINDWKELQQIIISPQAPLPKRIFNDFNNLASKLDIREYL